MPMGELMDTVDSILVSSLCRATHGKYWCRN